MNEEKVTTWLLGFSMGVMVVLGAEKIFASMEEEEVAPATPVFPMAVISAYNKGKRDALKTNPVSFELEETCMEVWANKQPTERGMK